MKRKTSSKSSSKPANNEAALSLGDLLSQDMAEQLKKIKKEKEQELQKQREEELARKQFEAKQREKNKTFEELLNETPMDWKKYK
ncbi:YqkE family protein [Ammoniphilus sp. CFH 90114]|uniref:YqkE family protein n=1 Tax=Ammoniphilus sp. CFH 90114 TaxID=2493665 RepID=UPI00100E5ACB|nr:YqkE family protein [Ammoniphilus sp. CFH 90114]RXT15213.1 DUF3886 domain-containing protein [Ammoniphilus sp. CFH 90114]